MHDGASNPYWSIYYTFIYTCKDPLECSSYRPISLLNSEVEILAKLIAPRLDNIISDIISVDQAGFIFGHQSFTNICWVLGVIHSSTSLEIPEVIVSLDAEKAFDGVEWEYVFIILNKLVFDQKLMSWVRLLYSSPKAAVITNKPHSVFPTFKGNKTKLSS